MTLDDYLSAISKRSNKFGSQLLKLMQYCDANCLAEVTYDKAKEFYEQMVRNNINDND